MGVTEDTVTTVADRYLWASWAVWDDAFPEKDRVETNPERLVEFITTHTAALTSEVVLLGLNRADDLEAPFANFHAPTGRHYDDRLKEFIQDDGLDGLPGAYMTDLADEVDPDSQNIEVTDEDAALLLEQLRLLGEHVYHVICFGNKPFDGLVDYFDATVTTYSPEIKHATVQTDGLTIHAYRVWFYGLYGIYQDKVEVLQSQLCKLNDGLAEDGSRNVSESLLE